MILILWLALAFALGAGIVYGLVRAALRWPLGFIAASVLLCVGLRAGWALLEHRHRLAFVPQGLQVRSIEYANEASWGFGPGGNEAGIVVYALPVGVADRIEAQGVRFLDTLGDDRSPRSGGWQGRFDGWKPTPVAPDAHWPAGAGGKRSLVYDYVCAYGFCIDIEDTILKDAEAALLTPGNYYAYGRIGMIVVSPKRRRAYFLYNG